MMPADKNGSVKLKNGRAVINVGTMKNPGFRDCRLVAVVNGKTYKHHVKVGFSPEKLQPYTELPDDFLQKRLTVIWLSCNASAPVRIFTVILPVQKLQGNILWYCALRELE